MKNTLKFEFDSNEKSLIIKSISMLRNDLLSQNMDVGVADDILLKFSDSNKVELDVYEYKIVLGALNSLKIDMKEKQQSSLEVNDIILRMVDEIGKKKVLSRILRKDNGRRY